MKLKTLFLLALLAVAACAPAQTPWLNVDLPKERWAGDWSACKRTAERQVVGYRDESSGPLDNYDRIQAKRQIDAYVSACMTDRGYVRARPQTAPSGG